MVVRILLLTCLLALPPALASGGTFGDPGPVELTLHSALGPCASVMPLRACAPRPGLGIGVRLIRTTGDRDRGIELWLDTRVDLFYSVRVLPALRLGPAGWPVQPYAVLHLGPEIASEVNRQRCCRVNTYASVGIGLLAPASTRIGFRLEIAYLMSPKTGTFPRHLSLTDPLVFDG